MIKRFENFQEDWEEYPEDVKYESMDLGTVTKVIGDYRIETEKHIIEARLRMTDEDTGGEGACFVSDYDIIVGSNLTILYEKKYIHIADVLGWIIISGEIFIVDNNGLKHELDIQSYGGNNSTSIVIKIKDY